MHAPRGTGFDPPRRPRRGRRFFTIGPIRARRRTIRPRLASIGLRPDLATSPMRRTNVPRAGRRRPSGASRSARAAHAFAASLLAAAPLAAGRAADGPHLSFLDPRGPVAAAQRTHFLEVIGLLAIVVVPVLVLVPLFAWRYRYSNERAEYRPNWEFSKGLEVLIWGVPVLIVAGLATFLIRSTTSLDPYEPLAAGDLPSADAASASGPPPLSVQVVGTDWKWLFVYPEEGIATIGELAFPTDRQMALEITSLTTVQSFFVPALGSQIYAMGGMANRLHLAADAPGEFLGENTQYNGRGFAEQKFVARALEPDDFEAWVATVRDTGIALDGRALGVVTGRSTAEEARAALPGAGDVPGTLYFDAVPEALFERLMARSRAARTGRVDGPLPASPKPSR